MSLTRATFENAMYFQLRSVERFNPPHPPPSPFSSSSSSFSSVPHRLPLQGQDPCETAFVSHSSVLVCTPLVFVCTAWDVVPLRFLYSVCTRLYSACTRLYRSGMLNSPRVFVLRLYSFVHVCIPFVLRLYRSGMLFPLRYLYSVCIRLYPHPVWRI